MKIGKIVNIIILIIIAAMVFIQFLPYGKKLSNPPVIREPIWATDNTRVYFMRVCGDCHSNETVYPWYSKVAPISWLLEDDVKHGRKKLNVSEWGSAKNDADEAIEEYESGDMPPYLYVVMHPESKLTETEKKEFIQGMEKTFGRKNSSNRENSPETKKNKGKNGY